MIDDLKKELEGICNKTNTSISGINVLIKYYTDSLRWSEEKAIKYTIQLFNNGTIEQIKLFNKDNKEI